MIATVAVIAVAAVTLLVLVATYNGLVTRRNRVRNAWAQIDVQLGRRHDLIPNLVETVRGYAAHERGLFERVTAARAQALAASGPAEQSQAETALTGALRGVLAVAENYPDLKSSANFLALQDELSETEDKISYARQFYNDAALGLNNAVETFPRSLVAGLFGFRQADYFEVEAAAATPVAVRF